MRGGLVVELDLHHHKFIMAFLVVVVLVVGVLFGVHIMGISGEQGVLALVFGMLFLHSVMLYVLFTQILHVHHNQTRKKK